MENLDLSEDTGWAVTVHDRLVFLGDDKADAHEWVFNNRDKHDTMKLVCDCWKPKDHVKIIRVGIEGVPDEKN